jgi:hypothetical protein
MQITLNKFSTTKEKHDTQTSGVRVRVERAHIGPSLLKNTKGKNLKILIKRIKS